MTNHEAESGLELVLDNRKLIVAFAVLIAICGCFFVVGFIEGKRQGFQEKALAATESLPGGNSDAAQVQTGNARAHAEAESPKQDSADQPLNWYKNVNSREAEPVTITSPPEPAPKTPAASVSRERPKPPAKRVAYTVQVGAFRQPNEMEIRAQMLRDKGFDCRTEPPLAPGQFYLLKVGRFQTRAEAVAMQLRLKKSGFSSFIKTE